MELRARPAAWFVACCIAGATRLTAADIAWTGARGSDWDDHRNWAGGKVPGAQDRAFFGSDAKPVRVRVDGDRRIGGIVCSGTQPIVLRGSGSLRLGERLYQAGPATVLVSVRLAWAPGAEPVLDGSGTGEVVLGRAPELGGRRLIKRGACPLSLPAARHADDGFTLEGGRLRVTRQWTFQPGADGDGDGLRDKLLVFDQGNLRHLTREQLQAYGLHIATGRPVTMVNAVQQGPDSSAVLVADGPGTVLTFDGTWNKHFDDLPFEMSAMIVQNRAVLRWGAHAELNNIQPDLTNSRPFLVMGDGLDAVLDCDAAFDADRMGWNGDPADPLWRNCGLATLSLEKLTWRTRSTANLPSVHKKRPGGGHGDSGILRIAAGPLRWEVLDSAQEFTGFVLISGDTELRCAQDLTIAGPAGEHPGPAICSMIDGIRVRKTGSGTLRLDVAQGWRTGSTLDIAEGAVVLDTDPTGGWSGGYPFDYAAVVGSARNLTIASHGLLDVRTPTAGIASLIMGSTSVTRIAAGNDLRTDAMAVKGGARLEIAMAADGSCGRLHCTQDFRPSGVTLALAGTPQPGMPMVVCSWDDEREGAFAAVEGMPAGYVLTYDDEERECRVEPAAPNGAG